MDLFLLCCKHCPNCVQCFIQMEMYEDFLDLSMGNLKDYLSLRGLSTTGRKVELVARAFSAFEMKLPVQVSQEQHLASLQREFQDRLRKYDLSDPKSSDTTWVDDMTKWPPVDLGKIFAYILSNKEFDSDYIGKYKNEKAYSYWKSNFVGTILYADNKDGKCVLQCKVTPSQRIREDPREVWVALKKDGTVLCGWCTCIAGTSATCNHIIASLYKMGYAFTHGYTDPSCTSVPCGWNVSTRRDVQPGKIMDMRIRRDKRTTGNEENEGIIIDEWRHFDPRKEGERNVTDEQKKGFLDGYKQIRPNAQIFKSVELEKHNQMDRPLELTKFAENFTASLDGSESEQDIVNKFLEAIPLSAMEDHYPVCQTEHHLSPNSLYILSQASFRDLNPIKFLLFDNNTTSWSGYPLSSWLSTLKCPQDRVTTCSSLPFVHLSGLMQQTKHLQL